MTRTRGRTARATVACGHGRGGTSDGAAKSHPLFLSQGVAMSLLAANDIGKRQQLLGVKALALS